jgi:hypothetical protein
MRPSVPALLVVLASASPALAGPTWLDAPPPLPSGDVPAPAGEPDEHARRTWEIVGQGGLALAGCRAPDAGVGICDGVGTGLAFGGLALARPWPHVALGVGVDFARHGFEPRERPAGAAGTSLATRFVGAVFRAYFSERGALDPWVQTGFGAGRARFEESRDGVGLDATTSGLATWAAAGVDVWATRWLKVGPSISWRWLLASDATVCTSGGACERHGASELGAATSSFAATLGATVAFGREL